MLFMGQEWGASTPFHYFTDHDPDLGRAVREGRAVEFRKYADFADPAQFALIPDPQAESTFLAGKLFWDERETDRHALTLDLYRTLLGLRRAAPWSESAPFEAVALDPDCLAIRLGIGTDADVLVVIRFQGEGAALLPRAWVEAGPEFVLVLTTEDPRFALAPEPIELDLASPTPRIHFDRPGAVILWKMPPLQS